MLHINSKFPKSEYPNKVKLQTCEINGYQFVIPAIYEGDVNTFVYDLFDQKEIKQSYQGKKLSNQEKIIDIGGHQVVVPYKWQTGKLDQQIVNRMTDIAILKYNSAVRIAKAYKMTNKSLSKQPLLTLDSDQVRQQFNKVMDIYGSKGRDMVHAFNKFFARYGFESAAKVITLPILGAAIAAKSSKKDNIAVQKLFSAAKLIHQNLWYKKGSSSELSNVAQKVDSFLDKVYDNFLHWSGPLIKKAAILAQKKYQFAAASFKNEFDEKRKIYTLWGTLGLSALSPILPSHAKSTGNYNSKAISVEHVDKSEKLDAVQLGQTIYGMTPIKYKISDMESFMEAFEAAKPQINRTLLAIEWFSPDGYSDNNNTASNTLAVGLWWYPVNGDPKSSDWMPTKEYLKSHPNTMLTYDKALDLTEGWFHYRNHGGVIKSMADRLQGCRLAPNELAAIASVYYNDEECGKRLCKFVKENYENPIACAHFISELKPKNLSFSSGIKKRHYHEALYYLNHNNYCAKVLNFNVRSGINSKGKFFVITPITKLELTEYFKFKQELDKAFQTGASSLGIQADKLIDKMCAYHPIAQSSHEQVISVNDFLHKNVSNNNMRLAMTDGNKGTVLPQKSRA